MAAPSRRLTVMMCRDCCCGSRDKHPSCDHDAQRRAIETVASDIVEVRVVECLDVCERSNVVLVRDHAAPRRDRDTWLGGVLYRAHTAALVEWVRAGGGAVPELIGHLRFTHHPTTASGPPS